MKKRIIGIVCILLCLVLVGCSNEYAKTEYNAPEKIASNGDRYAKTNSQLNTQEDSCRLTASHFDGRQTLWTEDWRQGETIQLELRLTLTCGQVKFVHVDEEGNVTTLLECTPETAPEGSVLLSVSMPAGRNKFKVVGYDCENLTCEFVLCGEA